MHKTIFFILILTLCSISQAQDTSSIHPLITQPDIRLFYISSLIYSGVNAGIEFPVIPLNQKYIGNPKSNRYIRERFISGNLSWYHHSGFHDNIFITVGWIMRRTKSSGFISEFSAGPGFSRTFLSGTTYKVNDNGKISVTRLAGYNYALMKLGGGFGYDFYMKKKLPLSSIATLSLISMFPYNSTLYFRPIFEIGIVYNLSGLRKHID